MYKYNWTQLACKKEKYHLFKTFQQSNFKCVFVCWLMLWLKLFFLLLWSLYRVPYLHFQKNKSSVFPFTLYVVWREMWKMCFNLPFAKYCFSTHLMNYLLCVKFTNVFAIYCIHMAGDLGSGLSWIFNHVEKRNIYLGMHKMSNLEVGGLQQQNTSKRIRAGLNLKTYHGKLL